MLAVTLIFALAAGIGVLLAVLGVSQLRQQAVLPDGVPSLGGRSPAALLPRRRLDPPASLRERLSRVFQPAADRLTERNRKKGRPSLSENLARADLKLRTSEYFMIQTGCVVLLGLIGLLRFGVGPQFIVMAAAGFFLPGLYVKRRQRRRLKAFNSQLGDTMVLLSNALKAGYSFAQAIDTVGKNAVAPMSDEFSRAVREMNLGVSVEEALKNMVARIESTDLDLMVTAVIIHRSVGGNLAEVLDKIAHTIRERIRIKGEISTLTAQARASGVIITLLPVALGALLYFVAPAYFKPMTEQVLGWVMLAFAAGMILIGNAFIRKIVNIEV
ncbi:MAG: type II secretion system F family protein [Candidatus Dormibacteraceae bacterium]